MKKVLMLLLVLTLTFSYAFAQEEENEEKKGGFKKENLFTGGSISLGFSNNTFLVGGNPVFGYSIARWLDAGVVLNYNYTSYRDVQQFNDRLRQTVYGGGVFTRIYPVRFLFAQGQFEHNFIKQKYIPVGGPNEKTSTSANSFLVGGGYATGRQDPGSIFFSLAVLFDISDSPNSPYTDAYGRGVPIIRGSIQVPLFQGKSRYR